MSYEQQRQTIESYFKTNWENLHPELPISWQNVKTAECKDGYVQISILTGGSELVGLGETNLYRHSGVISIDFYLPAFKGMRNADLYSDTIKTLFTGKSFGMTQCRSPSRTNLGIYKNHWRTTISIPFYRNEFI